MRLISSRMTYFYKHVFPYILVGVGFVFMTSGLFSGSRQHPHRDVSALIEVSVAFLFLFAAFVYWLTKKFLFPLADEVSDAGDAFVVRRGEQQERIAFSDIKSVNYAYSARGPSQITLAMGRPTVFGDSIAFQAPMDLTRRAAAALVDDLAHRIDAAHRKQ